MSSGSLDLPNDEPCAFCDYLEERRAYTILCKSERVAVLVTREQRGIGHLLVMPTRHYPTLLECTLDERHALIDTLAAAASAIDKAYNRPGIAVWQNNGIPAHQAIGHLHFHVAGTLSNGGTDFGSVPELSIQRTDAIRERILAVTIDKICS
jgi:histidine triad (HIT) family protein